MRGNRIYRRFMAGMLAGVMMLSCVPADATDGTAITGTEESSKQYDAAPAGEIML